MRQVARGPGFWIDLMLADLPSPAPQPPDGRVIDVQGWLELYLEPGSHLVLCGMNEGKVPAAKYRRSMARRGRRQTCSACAATPTAPRSDAFLYQAMLEARREGGRVDVICAKSGSGGESLLPSRLLLAADRDDLPERVKFLFRGIEPPEAGLRWHADWKWQPRAVEVSETPQRHLARRLARLPVPFLSETRRSACKARSPDRVEWNARDFGTVAHEVLERWGRDAEARGFLENRGHSRLALRRARPDRQRMVRRTARRWP